jgi:hypothetical protein
MDREIEAFLLGTVTESGVIDVKGFPIERTFV